MKIYKKVIPCLLAGSALLMTGCKQEFQDVVIAKYNGKIYLDRNGNGYADAVIEYNPADTLSSILYQYIQPSDTVYYYVSYKNDTPFLPAGQVYCRTVNGYTVLEIERIQQINQIRQGLNQPKTRGL
jgi:hypothetical protein